MSYSERIVPTIAVYSKPAPFDAAVRLPSHVSWQTVSGIWSSRMSLSNDGVHGSPETVADVYGEVAFFMRRPRTRWLPPEDPQKPGVLDVDLALNSPPGTMIIRPGAPS
jgi:hypothetical protein